MVSTLPRLASLIDLQGKTAVVTGAAQGFGAAIASRLAEAGANVVIADRNEEGAAATAERLAAGSVGRVVAQQVEITDEGSIDRMVRDANELFGRIDIHVNNAGIFSNYLVPEMPVAEFRKVLMVNVVGTFACAQRVAQSMLADGGGGAIVNIASVDAMNPSAEGLSHYTASKHGVAGITRSLAMELGPRGIRVNAVCPGACMTEGAIAFVQAGAPEGIDLEAQWHGIAERTPLGRLCDPDDVACAVLFLSSDLARFVNGVLLPVDGGILVQPLEGYAGSHPGDGGRGA